MYGFIDLLGDLGGVLEVIMVVAGGLLFPISEHHFTLQAAKRMFLARSSDPDVFNTGGSGVDSKVEKHKMTKYLSSTLASQYSQDVTGKCSSVGGGHRLSKFIRRSSIQSLANVLETHRLARVSLKDSLFLYLYNRFYCSSFKNWCWFWTWRKRSPLQKLYRETQDRLEKELNIVKLLRSRRIVSILTKQLVDGDEVSFELAHQPKNIIDCDAGSEDSDAEPQNSAQDKEFPQLDPASIDASAAKLIANKAKSEQFISSNEVKENAGIPSG